MKHKILITFFSLILLLLFGSVERILACSCIYSTPCQNYERADVVFVGKMIGEKKLADHSYSVNFEIFEAFKGILKTENQINVLSMQNAGGSCGYHFNYNETYLVFAKNGKSLAGIEGLWTGQCSGIQPIKYADYALDFLQKFKSSVLVSVVFGSLKDYSEGQNRNLPIEGIKIKAQLIKNKSKVFYGITNQYGNYEINVPAGNYLVSPELPKDFIFGETPSLKMNPIKVGKQTFNGKCFLIKNIAK